MSNMYAIKTSTLTALGDAIRSKTGRYIYTDEKTEPFLIATGTTNDLEMVGYDEMQNRNIYALPIDFRTMSAADVATRWYIEYSFETSDGKGPISSNIKFFNSSNTNLLDNVNNISIAEASSSKATISGNKTISVISGYTMAYLKIGIHPDRTHTISYDVKLWAMDSKGQYIDSNKYTPLEMAEAINGLDTIPTEALTITGSCNSRFANSGWNWFINLCGNKITTKDINNGFNMFYDCTELENIPFDINMVKSSTVMTGSMFYNCRKLKQIPMVNNVKFSQSSCNGMFSSCYSIRNFPEGFGENWDFSEINASAWGGLNAMFQDCQSLRAIPTPLLNNGWSIATSAYSCFYYSLFNGCYSLDEINGLGVSPASVTSNLFIDTFKACGRLANMTFQTNEDGTPKVVPWKNQTVDLSVITTSSASLLTQYNSGITADKEVKDDATYQALKNDPDWFTTKLDYCRYNHDSAVNTINSLPDCSATGTNTIKFKGAAGALTDGGAINTLTEEEIAVAAAKGWTVSLV